MGVNMKCVNWHSDPTPLVALRESEGMEIRV